MTNGTTQRYFLGISLAAMATLMLELTLTRVFSVTMWYHFAFMAISLALFGLGAGAIYLYLWPERFPVEKLESQSSRWMLLFAATLPVIFATIIRIPFDGGISWQSFRQLTYIYILSAIPFLLGGMAISLAFRHRSQVISRVYFYDLVGAGLGCALTLVLLTVDPRAPGDRGDLRRGGGGRADLWLAPAQLAPDRFWRPGLFGPASGLGRPPGPLPDQPGQGRGRSHPAGPGLRAVEQL